MTKRVEGEAWTPDQSRELRCESESSGANRRMLYAGVLAQALLAPALVYSLPISARWMMALGLLLLLATVLMARGLRAAWLLSRLVWALVSAVLIYVGVAVVAVHVWAGADTMELLRQGSYALLWLLPPLTLYRWLSNPALRRHFAPAEGGSPDDRQTALR